MYTKISSLHRTVLFILAISISLALSSCQYIPRVVADPTAPQESTSLIEVAVPQANLTDSFEIETIIENHTEYTLALHYPITNNTPIDDTLHHFIVGRIIRFKDTLLEVNQKSQESLHEFLLDFEVTYLSDSILSLKFTERTFMGGADSFEELYTFNFNRHTGEDIPIEALFYQQKSFLNYLSHISFDAFMTKNIFKISDEQWLIDGTAPAIDHFKRYSMSQDGFVLYFNMYQIAPRSEGHIALSLTEMELRPFLRVDQTPFSPDFQLAEYKRFEELQVAPEEESDYFVDPNTEDALPRKRIALTFDDGPHPELTPLVLDALDAHKAKATFFMLGNRISYYPDIVKRIVDSGHGIGNHSWNHPQYTALLTRAVEEQIQRTQDAFFDSSGVVPFYVRVPYGRFNQTVKRTLNMPLIQWSIDPKDWELRNSDLITAHVLKYAHDGGVVLLHDIHPSTAKAVSGIISGLIDAGYDLVTIEDLFDLTSENSVGDTRVFYRIGLIK